MGVSYMLGGTRISRSTSASILTRDREAPRLMLHTAHQVAYYDTTEVIMIRACELDELPPGESVRVLADVPIAVFNADGEYYAIDDTCTHQDASLADGWLEDCTIECPLHAACFDLRTGNPTNLPAKKPVNTHPVVVYDGVVYVGVAAGVPAGVGAAEGAA